MLVLTFLGQIHSYTDFCCILEIIYVKFFLPISQCAIYIKQEINFILYLFYFKIIKPQKKKIKKANEIK